MKIDLDKVAAIQVKDNRESEEWNSATKGEAVIKEASRYNALKVLHRRECDFYWIEFTTKNGHDVKLLVPETEIEEEVKNE